MGGFLSPSRCRARGSSKGSTLLGGTERPFTQRAAGENRHLFSKDVASDLNLRFAVSVARALSVSGRVAEGIEAIANQVRVIDEIIHSAQLNRRGEGRDLGGASAGGGGAGGGGAAGAGDGVAWGGRPVRPPNSQAERMVGPKRLVREGVVGRPAPEPSGSGRPPLSPGACLGYGAAVGNLGSTREWPAPGASRRSGSLAGRVAGAEARDR
jgi:hypothetical protein